MMHLTGGFFRSYESTGFRHRATFRGDGAVYYRLTDGSGHVRLTAAEWEALGRRFQERSGKVVRRGIWLLVGIVPGVPLFALTLGQVLPVDVTALAILAALGPGPVAILAWQMIAIRRIAAALDSELAGRVRREAPPPVIRPPRWLVVAGLLLVGPGLLLAVVAELGGPVLFRGAGLDMAGIAGLIVFAALLLYRWRAERAGK